MHFVEFCASSDISVSSDTGSHRTPALWEQLPAYSMPKNRAGPGWANCNTGKRGKGKTERQRNLMRTPEPGKAESVDTPLTKKKKKSHPESKIDIQAKEIWRESDPRSYRKNKDGQERKEEVEELIF